MKSCKNHLYVKIDRTHKTPGRFFAKCSECGDECQVATKKDGTVSYFKTGTGSKGGQKRRVHSFRLSDEEAQAVRELKKQGRLTKREWMAGT